MFKRIFFAVLGLVVVVGALAGIKVLQIKRMIAHGEAFVPPPEVVTTTTVTGDSWESLLTAVGSLEAVQGGAVTAELKGKVTRIAFEPGSMVAAGALLVQQDTSVELADLRAAEAVLALAKLNLERARELFSQRSISKSKFDITDAEFKQAEARVDNIRAMIAKKNIRAPFAGRLGIREIDLGQVLNEGDVIVSLQSMDPIYANFFLPQEQLSKLLPGLLVRLTTDAFPGQTMVGKITTISPQVEAASRNIRIQATAPNPDELLRPGMFVNVSVVLPEHLKVSIIPVTSVLYAPYGDSVFVVEEEKEKKKDEKKGADGLHLRQQFVRLGEKRGDFVSVLQGLSPDETIVSSGVFKLRNGQAVVVDNRLAPEFKKSPTPADT